jgi:hypothetical protein
MKETEIIQTLSYDSIVFDEDGFWDSEQFEEELPIQFDRDDVPNQEYLDVLLKAWNNVDVDMSLVLGDQENFDALAKRVFHNGNYWLVRISGSMAVREIRKLDNAQPLPFIL